MPVTVTVCGVFQFVELNVTLTGKTVPSNVLSELNPIVTSSVGSVLRTIVNVAVVPSSTVFPLIPETLIPTTSSSIFITDTSSASIPL